MIQSIEERTTRTELFQLSDKLKVLVIDGASFELRADNRVGEVLFLPLSTEQAVDLYELLDGFVATRLAMRRRNT